MVGQCPVRWLASAVGTPGLRDCKAWRCRTAGCPARVEVGHLVIIRPGRPAARRPAHELVDHGNDPSVPMAPFYPDRPLRTQSCWKWAGRIRLPDPGSPGPVQTMRSPPARPPSPSRAVCGRGSKDRDGDGSLPSSRMTQAGPPSCAARAPTLGNVSTSSRGREVGLGLHQQWGGGAAIGAQGGQRLAVPSITPTTHRPGGQPPDRRGPRGRGCCRSSARSPRPASCGPSAAHPAR